MAKKSLKIITLLTLMAIPQTIDNGYSPKKIRLESIEYVKKESKRNTYKDDLIPINENIYSLERKKEFLLMRLDEKNLDESIKKNYLKILRQTNESLKKRYYEKDSIYKLIKK